VITLDCEYELCEKEKFHHFPDDWRLGGAADVSPAADPRWFPTTYFYYDEKLQEIWMTQGPMCDEEAIDLFTWVNSFDKFHPVYIGVKRPGEEKPTMMPIKYDPTTDIASALT
jgi:hypothetical protein